MKIIAFSCLSILIALSSLSFVKAQATDRQEQVESAKVAYITKSLNLSVEQSQKFWPVYNEFKTEQQKIRKQLRNVFVSQAMAGEQEAESKANFDKLFALRQQEVDLEKTYYQRFASVIGYSKTAKYLRADKEFNRMLLRRLQNFKGSDLPDE